MLWNGVKSLDLHVKHSKNFSEVGTDANKIQFNIRNHTIIKN